MSGLKSQGIKNLFEVSADIVPQSTFGIISWWMHNNVIILNRLTIDTINFLRTSGVCCVGNICLGARKGGTFCADWFCRGEPRNFLKQGHQSTHRIEIWNCQDSFFYESPRRKRRGINRKILNAPRGGGLNPRPPRGLKILFLSFEPWWLRVILNEKFWHYRWIFYIIYLFGICRLWISARFRNTKIENKHFTLCRSHFSRLKIAGYSDMPAVLIL
jgi:hypothetical protein